MPLISMSRLHADPRNANVCNSDTLTKLQRNIERFGLYPALIVRPHPAKKGHFMILDGHHRKQVLESLGHLEVDCQVWNVDESGAQLALATLNRLRGEDDPRKRAELIHTLSQSFSLPDLSALIPESEQQIADLLALLSLDWEAAETKIMQQIACEQETLPVPFACMVAKADYPDVEKALAAMAGADQGAKLVALCRYLLNKEVHHESTESGHRS